MTYEVLKSALGHTPVYILELDLPRCSNVYADGAGGGGGFCTANLGPGLECYQTFANCQDTPNFNAAVPDSEITYRFAIQRVDEIQQAGEPPTIPSMLLPPVTTPTRLLPGNKLSIRSTVTIEVSDHPWNDIVTDPYRKTRPYVPEEQGSFWGKWLIRNKFYEGRNARVLTGYLDAAGIFVANNFLTRHYLIHKVTGPNYDGRVTVELKDPLKKADADKAQWPPSPTATVDGAINSSVTSITYADPSSNLFDFLTANHPTQKFIRIDDEVIEVDSFTASVLTVTRASMSTFYVASTNIADAHSDEANIQMCFEFVDEPIQDVLEFLLETPSGIPSSFIPKADWDATIDAGGYNVYLLSTLLTESLGVRRYLEELNELNVYIWWDERAQEVDLATLTLSAGNVPTYDEDVNIVDGSVDVVRDVKGRMSRVQLAYAIRNPTFDMMLIKNYQSVELKVDTDAESSDEYDQIRAKFIFSRWLTVAKRPIASEITSRLLIDNRDTKDIASLVLAPKDDTQWTGDIVKLNTRLIQDEAGANKLKNFQIIEVNEQLDIDGVKYGYMLREAFTVQRSGVITPNTNPEDEPNAFPDYDVATDTLKDQYAFIAFDDAPDPPGTSGVPGFNDNQGAYQIV